MKSELNNFRKFSLYDFQTNSKKYKEYVKY